MQRIKGYEGLYAATRDGRIYSLKAGKCLKPRLYNGYHRITLSKDGIPKTHKVHRIIATAYLDNPHDYPEVNHKDKNRTNNHVSNLEWCSRSQNIDHAWRRIRSEKEDKNIVLSLLKRGASMSEICTAAKLPPSKVLKYKFDLN